MKQPIKDIILSELKEIGIGKIFLMKDLVTDVQVRCNWIGKKKGTSYTNIDRRFRELHNPDGEIRYEEYHNTRFKVTWIDNDGVGGATITPKTSRMGERVSQSVNTAYSASSPAFSKGVLF